MIVNSKLYRAARDLSDSAQPIARQHATAQGEYVVPRAKLEALQAAMEDLTEQRGNRCRKKIN